MATKSGPGGPLFAEKAVPPSEKWTRCSFISLARLWGIKSITNGTFITVLYHERSVGFSAIHITNEIRGHRHWRFRY